jgi:class 3 adenylate cyclase/tetratricopeptide (TPR) repeat protein
LDLVVTWSTQDFSEKRPSLTESAAPAPPTADTASVTTFLIGDIRGYTAFTLERGDAAAKRLTTRFAEIAGEVVNAHDGRVAEVRGDEVLAVFASARQALRAALELRARCRAESSDELPLNVGVGLDAGEALPMQDGFRGAALNLAARLCSIAGPGEILASETVFNLARKVEGVDYNEAGDVVPKGFSERVRVFRISTTEDSSKADEQSHPAGAEHHELPIGGFLGALPSTSLIGRQAELERIAQTVRQAEGGSGRLVLLAGEPGVGKTRLAQDVTLQLRNRGFLIAAGACYEARQATAFAPFMELLSGIYATAPTSIRAVTARRWPYLAKLLPGEDIKVPALDGSDEKERLFWAVTSFLQTVAAEVPVALLLDDLHWADGSSLELLQHLARHTRANRVFVLGTYRDVEVGRRHPLEATLRELRRQELAEKIAVSRLDRADTSSFVASSFETAEISSEFAELLYQRTDGNPFFLQQVLRALVESGDVYRNPSGTWDRRAVEEIEVPESVRSVIGQRLSRLSEESQTLLMEASVLGQSFGFEELTGMTGRSEDEIEAALEEAGAAGLIRYEPHDRYAFDHALTQGTLYAELSPRRKRRLHLMAGESLLRLREDEQERRIAELAWHFTQGDDSARALEYSLRAGDAAEALFAHSDAEWHYRTAIELADDLSDEGSLSAAIQKLGTVLVMLARYDEAIETLERAVSRFAAAGRSDEELRAVALIGRAHALRGTYEQGLARLSSSVEKLESGSAASSGPAAAIYAALGNLHFRASRYQEELDAADRAATLAREAGDERLYAASQVERGTALAHVGRPSDALQALREGVELAEKAGDLTTLQRGLNNTASVMWDVDQFVEAEAYSVRSLEAAERAGDPGFVAFTLTIRGVYPWIFGKWDEALDFFKRAAAIARPLGASQSAWTLTAPSHVYVYRGQDALVQEELTDALAYAEKYGDRRLRVVATWLLAENHLMHERAEQAIPLLEENISLSDLRFDDRVDNYLSLSRAYLDVGDLARAEACLRSLAAMGKSSGFLHAGLETSRAMLLSLQGNHETGAEAYERALADARHNRSPYAEAFTLYTWGLTDLRREATDVAAERLRDALDIFQRLGAAAMEKRSRRALEEAGAGQ